MPALRRLLSAVAVIAAAACNSTAPNEGVTVAASATAYAAGSLVAYTITNPLFVSISYSSCARIERKTATAYELVPPEETCQATLIALAARRAVTRSVQLPDAATGGTYRVSILLTTDSGSEIVSSGNFTVP